MQQLQLHLYNLQVAKRHTHKHISTFISIKIYKYQYKNISIYCSIQLLDFKPDLISIRMYIFYIFCELSTSKIFEITTCFNQFRSSYWLLISFIGYQHDMCVVTNKVHVILLTNCACKYVIYFLACSLLIIYLSFKIPIPYFKLLISTLY